MNGHDLFTPDKVAGPTVRRRTSTRVGSRIVCHDAELEVIAIGPFAREGASARVVFLAKRIDGARFATGAILDTPWGICEIVG